jgi:hypothetical protein
MFHRNGGIGPLNRATGTKLFPNRETPGEIKVAGLHSRFPFDPQALARSIP